MNDAPWSGDGRALFRHSLAVLTAENRLKTKQSKSQPEINFKEIRYLQNCRRDYDDDDFICVTSEINYLLVSVH